MRLPLKGSDHLCSVVNPAIERIDRTYLESIGPAIKMHSINAMLGDGTVTQTDTFDPAVVRAFYQRLEKNLSENGWSQTAISASDTDDLRRIFLVASKGVGRYHLGGYFGVQYHALPYYRVDKRVIEIQKELARIADEAGNIFGTMAGAADKALQLELEKKGYSNLDFEDLFSRMFDDEKLVEDLDVTASAIEDKFPRFKEIGEQKARLFGELNDLLIETYQTSHVAIDHNRQMQGEEGVTTYFDLEVVKNKKTGTRDAIFDSGKVAQEWARRLADELDLVDSLIKKSL